MDSEEIIALVAVLLLFGGGTLFLLAVSPIGKALAARIRGAAGAPEDGDLRETLQAVQSELEDMRSLRHDVAELAERVDFAERLLARRREPEKLGPGA